MSKILKEYINLILTESHSQLQWMRKPFITWGEIKTVLKKTKDKKLIKGVINKFITRGIGTFMGIKLPGSGIPAEELCDRVLEKINSSDASKIFISLCIDTQVFGEISSEDKKAVESLKPEVVIEVINNMLKEMKSVSDDTNIEKVNFTKIFNSFLTHTANLKISK